jgi:hypothetical protein
MVGHPKARREEGRVLVLVGYTPFAGHAIGKVGSSASREAARLTAPGSPAASIVPNMHGFRFTTENAAQ